MMKSRVPKVWLLIYAAMVALTGCKNEMVSPEPDTRLHVKIEDHQFLRSTYFFIDQFYREQFRHYENVNWTHNYDPSRAIVQVEFYISGPSYDVRQKAIPGVAYRNLSETLVDSSEIYRGHFIRLSAETDFWLESRLGYIRLNMPLSDSEVLAVAYQDSSGRIVGDLDHIINPAPNNRELIELKLISPRVPIPSQDPNSTWKLAWKNVYQLGSTNISEEGFEVKFFFKSPSGDNEETLIDNQGRELFYLQLFGFDSFNSSWEQLPDNKIDLNPNIVDLARGELIFPDLRPFDPAGVFIQNIERPIPLPDGKRTSVIYDTSSQVVIRASSKFFIEVKYSN